MGAQDRVIMMRRQAQEWRTQAERALVAHKVDLDRIRERCEERVQAESGARSEKLMLARNRHAQCVALAGRRITESEARRDVALAENVAVMARIRGAAAEARRRGLDNIANIL